MQRVAYSKSTFLEEIICSTGSVFRQREPTMHVGSPEILLHRSLVKCIVLLLSIRFVRTSSSSQKHLCAYAARLGLHQWFPNFFVRGTLQSYFK